MWQQNFGDATLVSSNNVENVENNNVEKCSEIENTIETVNIIKEESEEDTYFISSKLERDNIYSMNLETYQEIYNNQNSSTEQKNKAIEEIAKINKERNRIMIAENLVIAKGFENIVIFANDKSISVIIKADKLEPQEIAQIQNIVSRELEVEAENISISTK